MKTAECEGDRGDRRAVGGGVRGACGIGGADRGQPQCEGRGGCRRARQEDRGLRREELPRGPAHGLRAAREEMVSGVESDGMLASGAELGINRDHEGIVELGSLATAARPIASSRSITRASRTVPICGAITAWRAKWRRFSGWRCATRRKLDLLPQGPAAIEVQIEDLDLCPRYSALVFENVTVQPSPLWLQYRLTAIGLNPINNIVDMTNFVMAELAQPMHAFDADLLHGDTIFVRPAKAGEPFRALNDEDVHARPVEPGDRRCGGRDCAGRA